jgi:hypothetical protein
MTLTWRTIEWTTLLHVGDEMRLSQHCSRSLAGYGGAGIWDLKFRNSK